VRPRYPRIFEGLMGWTIQSIACGAQHFAVSASYQDEHSTITWCARKIVNGETLAAWEV
jgi:hypothetical protein